MWVQNAAKRNTFCRDTDILARKQPEYFTASFQFSKFVWHDIIQSNLFLNSYTERKTWNGCLIISKAEKKCEGSSNLNFILLTFISRKYFLTELSYQQLRRKLSRIIHPKRTLWFLLTKLTWSVYKSIKSNAIWTSSFLRFFITCEEYRCHIHIYNASLQTWN